MKTSELSGAALDWAVAKCEDMLFQPVSGAGSIWFKMGIWTRPGVGGTQRPYVLSHELRYWVERCDNGVLRRGTSVWQPSIDWAQGGPIIERERISIRQWTNVPVVHAYMPIDGAEWSCDATSPLVAAMRCYVASKLGTEVEIPKELIK